MVEENPTQDSELDLIETKLVKFGSLGQSFDHIHDSEFEE